LNFDDLLTPANRGGLVLQEDQRSSCSLRSIGRLALHLPLTLLLTLALNLPLPISRSFHWFFEPLTVLLMQTKLNWRVSIF